VLDGRVFVYFFKQRIRQLYSSLVAGGNATFIGSNRPIKEEEAESKPYSQTQSVRWGNRSSWGDVRERLIK
jgi:hypothetical protein